MSRFIIIPEPHISYKNMTGRNDYVSEIKSYMSKIYDYIILDEYINNTIFVGDIFNMGFKDVDEYFYWIDWFKRLSDLMNTRGGRIYSTIGNHEISYSKSNPFWRLTSLLDDGYTTDMRWFDKSTMPQGFSSIISVPDVVELENNCSVFFCHYNKINEMKDIVDNHIDKYGSDKIRICVSHNSIISDEIVGVLKNKYNRDPLSNYIQYERINSLDLFHKFEYVFNGHMHRAFSQFTISSDERDTRLFYLGSLGRTNSEEINDSDLKRICPIYDTSSKELIQLNINLLNKSNSLRDGYIEEKEERVEQKYEYGEVCRKIIDVSDPVGDIMKALSDTDMIVAMECSTSYSRPHAIDEFKNKFMELINNG